MKTIGLLGGMSWPSTIEYYKILNELVHERLGQHHSARILLKSIDYNEIKSHYHHGWDEIPEILQKEIVDFLACMPDCLILCNNTLHKAYDIIERELSLPIPFFHVIELTRRHALERKYDNILLLGTQFTMEDGFFARKLEEKGLIVHIPILEERRQIQHIQSQLSKGILLPEFEAYFTTLLQRYCHLDAIILACTELPLAINREVCPIPIIDPIHLQCQAAVDYALG